MQYLIYFQFNFVNWVMGHRIPIARYILSGSFKEIFIIYSPLETTTMASDILEKVSPFFFNNIFFLGKYLCVLYRWSTSCARENIKISILCDKVSSKSERNSLYDTSSDIGLQNTSSSIREVCESNNSNC